MYALNAGTGNVIWQRSVGAPVTSGLPCGNINPLGITGTPVVDLASRSLFFDAMIAGATIKHLIFSLNVDTGATRSGWPVDVNAKARYNGLTFTSSIQNQRGALGFVNGVVYVPYSGHFGDCGTYHGWVVGVPINNPSNVTAWATSAIGGGIWGHGGVASGGTNMFVSHREHIPHWRPMGRRRSNYSFAARAGLQRKPDRLLGAHELAAHSITETPTLAAVARC